MKMFGYGEDAFTLWFLRNRLPIILEQVEDISSSKQCKVFFRPSFGRRGGENSSQFGEFDFILLSGNRLYLGESKWHRSSEKLRNNTLELRKEQLLRHEIFQFYVREWAFGTYADWAEFAKTAWINLGPRGAKKPVAPADSLLASNLQTVLGIIRHHFSEQPPVVNMLLYLHDGTARELPRQVAGHEFVIVGVDCSSGCCGNFIML